MIKDVKEGLMVTDFLGLWAGEPDQRGVQPECLPGIQDRERKTGRAGQGRHAGWERFRCLEEYRGHQPGARMGQRSVHLLCRLDALCADWEVECDGEVGSSMLR